MSENQPPEPPRRPNAGLLGRRPPAERIPGVQRQSAPSVPDETRQHAPVAAATARPTPASSEPTAGTPEGFYLPWWTFVVVILAVAGITCGLWGFVLLNRGDVSTASGPTPTPIFVVITPTSTLGPPPDATSEAPPPVEAVPTLPVDTPVAPEPPVASQAIQMDGFVEVFNTEGAGVAVRQGPGTDYSYFFVGNDGDRFQIKDGPRESSGYTWWYIVDSNNPDRAGWAVADFLRVVP